MEYRTFGSTGLKVSIVGFGGIVVAQMAQEDADRTVARAVDRGVNYFDVAPTYYDAQDRLGPALKPYRSDVHLACKTAQRTKAEAQTELENSLNALETDYLDVYQLHGVRNLDELNTALGPGGAIETLVKAKECGKARFIGITTHTAEVAMEALKRFDFDTILFPVNFVIWNEGNNGPQVLELAASKKMGRAAIKSLARTAWPDDVEKNWSKCWYQPIDDPQLAELAVRFTLSQDVHVILPPGHVELFEMALEFGEKFKPLSLDEEAYLKNTAKQISPLFTTECEV